jgi:Ca2+-binding EF-hand superfamily protein
MGLKGSKPKLSKEDLEFLKKNTNFTEEQIKEWYKGFVVSLQIFVYKSQCCRIPKINISKFFPYKHLRSFLHK